MPGVSQPSTFPSCLARTWGSEELEVRESQMGQPGENTKWWFLGLEGLTEMSCLCFLSSQGEGPWSRPPGVVPSLLVFTQDLARPVWLPEQRPWPGQVLSLPPPLPQLPVPLPVRRAQATVLAAPGAALLWARPSRRHLVPGSGDPSTYRSGWTLGPTPGSLGVERLGLLWS